VTVLARFYVQSIQRFAYNPENVAVGLQAVSRGSENKVWASATPVGQVTMTINDGPAGQWFADRLGKDVLVSFDEAPAPE